MKTKRLLLLGGSTQQIPAIEYANKQGYYTILCDYLPDNPGQYYAKKFYCVSTTDKDLVLSVAREEKIDGIVAYASDPAAPTAAYVAEKLKLPTNPYKSVEILAYKDQFRNFLSTNGFNSPKAISYQSMQAALNDIELFSLPIIVKPIDSSGSKGVTKVEKPNEYKKALCLAFDNSRAKKIIVEEFIIQDHPHMVAGDCFVIDGKVKFWGLLNSHRNKKSTINPFVPIGTTFPLLIEKNRELAVFTEIEKLFSLLDISFGAFNIEILFDKNDNLYFIEMGPRNGGNMIPDLLLMATGNDMIAATIETALGNSYVFEDSINDTFISTFVLHSDKNGILQGITYKNDIEPKIIKQVLYKKKGDSVEYFDGANKALGIFFLKFDTQKEQQDFMNDPSKWIEVMVI